MKGYAIRTVCSAISLWLVEIAVPGFSIQGGVAWSIGALAVGLGNGLVRTAIVFYLFPLRLGMILCLLLAVNAVLLALFTVLLEGFAIGGALSGLVGWLAMAGMASVVTLYIGPDGTLYSMIPRRQRRAAP